MLGHEVQEPHEREHAQKVRSDGPGEHGVGEQPDVQHGVRSAKLTADEPDSGQHGHRETDDHGGPEPVAREGLDAVDEGSHGRHDQDDAGDVDWAGVGIA